MAVDKRSGPASTGKENQALGEDELGNYGVWVKSEPRDVSEFAENGRKAGSVSGGLEDIEDDSSIKDESFLSLEEETLLDSFDQEPPPSSKDDSLEVNFSIDDIKKPMNAGSAKEEPLELSLDALESEDFPEPSALEGLELGEEQDIEPLDFGSMEAESLPSGKEDLQEEFSVPEFSISDSESEETKEDSMDTAEREEPFDALLDAEEIDLGDIPAIELEEEPEILEEALEEAPEEKAGTSVGEEELSLEDFGMSEEEEKPSKPEKAKDTGTSEVSLEDFVDIESFGVSMEDSPSKEGEDELEPIEMDLDFDDSIDAEPLSMVHDHETAPQSFEDTLGDEGPAEYTGPKIDTETVTDFDDFLKSDSQPQIVRQSGKQEQAPQERSLDVSEEFLDASLIEETDVEDQTGLISEAEGVALSLDGSAPESGPVGGIEAKTALFDAETEDALAHIESVSDEAPMDAIPQATEELPDFEFAEEPEEAPGEFDDLQALESSLAEAERPEEGGRASASAQASILQKIADELSTIKDELASLKTELSSIKAGAAEAPAPDEGSSKKPVGFFDEEEDETIALTGDELDNILNTADFTEETGASQAHEPESAHADEEDLIPLDGGDKAPIEKVSLGAEGRPAAHGAKDDRGAEDLKRINDQGLSPMTEAPDDTSYLEEPISEELESMTLPDTPLEEPDLSGFEISDEAVSGAVEQGIDLVDETEVPEEESLDDITLDLDTDSGLSPDILAENAETEELADPFAQEDESFSELSLADERTEETEALEDLPELAPEEEPEPPKAKAPAAPKAAEEPAPSKAKALPPDLKNDIKSVLQYMDRLLESLPEDKIEEFAHSEHFAVYKKLFEELGLL